jgi:hypothetical protein
MSHVYRWHPQLTASIDGPMVGKTLLHLQQSDLDGACAQHCALMALMLFGEIKRDDLEGKPKKALASFWKAARPYYFCGTKPNKLAAFFKPYRHAVSSWVVLKDIPQNIREAIHADGLAIVGIRNANFEHWSLVVGIGGREGFPEDEKLLLLDPDFPPIPMLPWNTTLSLNHSRRGWHEYDTAAGSSKVRITDAVCLLQYIEEIDVDIN